MTRDCRIEWNGTVLHPRHGTAKLLSRRPMAFVATWWPLLELWVGYYICDHKWTHLHKYLSTELAWIHIWMYTIRFRISYNSKLMTVIFSRKRIKVGNLNNRLAPGFSRIYNQRGSPTYILKYHLQWAARSFLKLDTAPASMATALWNSSAQVAHLVDNWDWCIRSWEEF